jgi:hypothetical protein
MSHSTSILEALRGSPKCFPGDTRANQGKYRLNFSTYNTTFKVNLEISYR